MQGANVVNRLGLKITLSAVSLFALSPLLASDFDPISPDVLYAYEGEVTYAKRQMALAGLNDLRIAASLDPYGGVYGSVDISATASGLPTGYITAPTMIRINTLFSVSSDTDLGLPGESVYLNNALLRVVDDVATPRAFNIGDGGAVIDTSGFGLLISGDLVADGVLLKQGEGALTLTGNNTWNSTPYLHGGILRGNTDSLQTPIKSGSQGSFFWDPTAVCLALYCKDLPAPLFVPTHPQASISPVVEFNQDFDGVYRDVIRGTAQLVKSGVGEVVFTGENSYGGGTKIIAGTLALVDAGTMGAGSLHINTGATFDMSEADGNRTATGLSGSGQVKLGNQGLNLKLAEDALFQGRISGSGWLDIEASESATPTLTLTGISNFAGGLYIDNDTTLALSGAGSLGSLARLAVHGVFDVSAANNNRQVGSMSGHGVVKLGSNSLTVGTNDQYSYFSGRITGAGGLTKVGAGSFNMMGIAEYSGVTAIEQGIFRTHTAGLSRTVVNNGMLKIGHTYKYGEEAISAYSGEISGTGELVKTGNGVVWLRGNNSYSGGTQIVDGALIGNTESLQGDFSNSSDIGFYQIEDGLFSGRVQGDGRLFKFGPGKLSLTAANTHTGGTFFTGTLEINDDAALGAADAELQMVNGRLLLADDVSSTRSVVISRGGSIDTSTHNLRFAGAVSWDGRLNKLGSGTLQLAGGNLFMGLLRVQEGRLDIAGTIGHSFGEEGRVSDRLSLPFFTIRTEGGVVIETVTAIQPNPGNSLHISPGAELGGSGLIDADVVNQGAIVRGAEIGDVRIAGDIDFAVGSSFLVKANAVGESDRILLSRSDATATLQGGHVSVRAQNGNYKKRTRYTILTAPGGVEGRFTGASSNLAFLDPKLSYDPQNVFLQLIRNDVRYTDAGANATQRATGQAMESMSKDATGDAAFVLDTFDLLTATEASAALQSIAGSDASGMSQTTQLQQRALVQTTSNRLAYLDSQDGMTGRTAFSEAHRWVNQGTNNPLALYAVLNAVKESAPVPHQQQGVWMRGFGGAGSVDGGAGAGDTSYDVYGFLAGYDYSTRTGMTYGVLGGYSEGDTSQDGSQSDAKTESWQLGGYGRYRMGNMHFDAVLSYSKNQVDSSRSVIVGGLIRQAKADFDGHAFNAYLEAAVVNAGVVNIQPYASLQFIKQYWDGYTETGAGALNLKVADSRNNSLRSTFGVRSSFSLGAESETSNTLELRAGWSHEFESEGSKVARLAGDMSNSRFVINSRALPRDSAILGVSLISTPKENITLLTEINGEFNREQYDISAVVGVRYEW